MSESGLKAVFLEERPMLMRLLIARLNSREEAEDALQDMWFKLDQLASKPVAQPTAYLYRMAANLAADRRISAVRSGVRDTAWSEAQPTAEGRGSVGGTNTGITQKGYSISPNPPK